MKISVIIPCYNAADKIGRCLASLNAIKFPADEFEVLFIDDCSSDGTYELLQQACAPQTHWRVLQLEHNSGSPSRPRNRGMDQARGEYVFFLDCDDEILPDTLRSHYDHARQTNACLIRAELWAEDGRGRKRMNQLPSWSAALSQKQRKELIVSKQSTVCPSFVKLELLRKHGILWPEAIRMGEDTLFLANVLAYSERVEYLSEPSFVYNKFPALTPSSTQRYGARELNDHLSVWTAAQTSLAQQGIDYYRCRLQVGLQTALAYLIHRGRGDIDENSFRRFAEFVNINWSVIGSFQYIRRYKDILGALQTGDFTSFKQQCRPRLLIAGHDLKFVTSVMPELAQHFDIRIDEWKGHDTHDEKQSLACLEWAELIWCEWLLGNAVWYAQRKRPNQRLVVRMHRMELGRDHGDKAGMEKVDAFVAVSVHFFERLLEKFPSIPRAKVRLLPNYLRVKEYRCDWSEQRLFTLGMIGILPSRKRLDIALEILARLRVVDSRYRLEVFGSRPEDLSWVARDKAEMRFFSDCRSLIATNDLQDSVSFRGHSDVKVKLAEHHVGFVLSVSDSDRTFPGPESFHIAVADGYAAGGIGLVLQWEGAEYVWPREHIFQNIDEIVANILSYRDDSARFQTEAALGKNFIEDRYDVDNFVSSVIGIFQEFT
jgi:glycosyltransferase involved in cell wall biosynthesis